MPPPPNIVLFMTDSMDGRVMRHLGHPAAYTPNMDRLAARGTSFSNAYCNSPQCAPSRASYWSGQYVHRVEAWNNPGGLPMEAPTFGTHLGRRRLRRPRLRQDRLPRRRPLPQGPPHRLDALRRHPSTPPPPRTHPPTTLLRERVACPGPSSSVEPDTPRIPKPRPSPRPHQGDWNQIDAACQFLNNHSADDPPYFLYPSTNVPHPPFRATQTWLDKIDPAAVTLPPYEADLHPVMDYMSVTKNTHGHFTNDEILAIRRHYFAMVAETDAMLGQVLDTLEATGQLNDTYIIFASDHGEMNMEHRQTLKERPCTKPPPASPSSSPAPASSRASSQMNSSHSSTCFPPSWTWPAWTTLRASTASPCCPYAAATPQAAPTTSSANTTATSPTPASPCGARAPGNTSATPATHPQLFNLHDDPEEIHNLAESRPDIVQNLNTRLESLVDFDAADAQAKANDRQNFQTWRTPLTPTQYQDAMSNAHQGVWGPDDDKRTRSPGYPSPNAAPPFVVTLGRNPLMSLHCSHVEG